MSGDEFWQENDPINWASMGECQQTVTLVGDEKLKEKTASSETNEESEPFLRFH